MTERAYIVVMTGHHPGVLRVEVIGKRGDWRLVQSPRRSDVDFEFGIHKRAVFTTWIEAWRRAKRTANRFKMISGESRELVFGTTRCNRSKNYSAPMRRRDCPVHEKGRISNHANSTNAGKVVLQGRRGGPSMPLIAGKDRQRFTLKQKGQTND